MDLNRYPSLVFSGLVLLDSTPLPLNIYGLIPAETCKAATPSLGLPPTPAPAGLFVWIVGKYVLFVPLPSVPVILDPALDQSL